MREMAKYLWPKVNLWPNDWRPMYFG
jgi:hypothetical protein